MAVLLLLTASASVEHSGAERWALSEMAALILAGSRSMMTAVPMNLSLVCAFLVACGALLAQHEYAATDIENGGRQYTNNCVYCHGPEGDQIPGINLLQGKFRRTLSDDDIARIIREGIPGTGMPAQNMNEGSARTIVAYLRSAAAVPASTVAGGNAARGKTIFEGKGNCTACHRAAGVGSRSGPDLSDAGALHRAVDLEQSLIDPGAVILPQNRMVRVVTKDGTTITGRLMNQDTFTLQLIDSQDRLRSFPLADLRQHSVITTSSMPSYKDRLNSQERADVVAYLVSLKGGRKP
jgi:putative heme-binding domain-containing protein